MRVAKRVKAATTKRRKVRPRRVRSRVDTVESALATLAHEIRTPLNGILALSELLAAAELPEREREWASLVKSAAEHLANLATLVVDGVRAEARGLALRDEPFRPRALAEAVGGMLAARAEAKGLAASIVIAADLPELVTGDRVRLRAALENLADNAVKFTEQGQVGFSVASAPSRGRHQLTFTVTDSGIGLTRAEIGKLFRPFAQANTSVGRRFAGAGLGLVFVKRLAEAMHGRLAVESAPGRGSTFRLTVTLAAATEKPAARQQRIAPARNLRVLCAEDNCPRRAQHDPDRARASHRLRRHRGGGRRRGGARRLRHRADGRDPAGPRWLECRARDPRLAGRRRGCAHHRRVGTYRAGRHRSRARGRHERLSAETRHARRAGVFPSPRAAGRRCRRPKA